MAVVVNLNLSIVSPELPSRQVGFGYLPVGVTTLVDIQTVLSLFNTFFVLPRFTAVV